MCISELYAFLSIAINGRKDENLVFNEENWNKLFSLATRHGVKGLLWQAGEIQLKSGLLDLPKSSVLKSFGQVQYVERETTRLYAISAEYAKGIMPRKCIVLKGIDYANFWPNPRHREFGDLDYYSGEDFELSNAAAQKIGGQISEAGYKHSHIYFKRLTIENHRFFSDFNDSKNGIKVERMLQQLLEKDGCRLMEGTENLYSPNSTFTALFLLVHAQNHFTEEGIHLKHVLDWFFFVRKYHACIDWSYMDGIYKELNVMNFKDLMTAFCIEKMGLAMPIPYTSPKESLLLKFEDDIFNHKTIDRLKKRNMIDHAIALFESIRRKFVFRSVLKESFYVSCRNFVVYGFFHKKPEKEV